MINYFTYDYPKVEGDDPLSIFTDLSDCPWNEASKLVRVAIKGKTLELDERQASNLVFLIDVSGSMGSHDKLPLLKAFQKSDLYSKSRKHPSIESIKNTYNILINKYLKSYELNIGN